MKIAIIGGGPAGLMAAEAACATGAQVDLYDAMASVGRKFLLAGKGGLNLTHSEPFEKFLSRYGVRRAQIAPLLTPFGPDALRAWARGLGIETFVGTSGRVFPTDLKAAPLLRAWLRRLRQARERLSAPARRTLWLTERAPRAVSPGSVPQTSAVVLEPVFVAGIPAHPPASRVNLRLRVSAGIGPASPAR